jgi:hypothetical protein
MRHLWETPGVYNGKQRVVLAKKSSKRNYGFWLRENILASHIPNALTEKLNYRYITLYVGIKQTVLICQFKFSFLDI